MLSSLPRDPRRDRSPLFRFGARAPSSPTALPHHLDPGHRQSSGDGGDDRTITEEDEDDEEEQSEDEEEGGDADADDNEDNGDDINSDEDGPDDSTPLLPIFSAARLDAIPVFELTHAIRLLITSRCDTVLSWDQLRSPQVSQFLVRPIQQEIRASHFNAAREYALMANCLQYHKEVNMYPGSSGVNRTRAMVCELLAIKLLKEYSTRELIDALSYDFNPLQGQPETPTAVSSHARPGMDAPYKHHQKAAKISCLEIAIRAQAKRFLAHPLVVQQLEAIWAGNIVFHCAADSMHRRLPPDPISHKGYGTNESRVSGPAAVPHDPLRRTVTLYDPRHASLFKLSRLRVPRYRNILSTMSFAVLLGLFLAVLIERSREITTLEVVFWFWAAGYMLDEIVGFNEQGFSLYIASFWNTIDLGILVLLFIHFGLRLYGIVMPDVRKRAVANLAYDVLAADAILLFPRLFSVLDHYRYFSPLLIAFRYMAIDLLAVSLLIIISCSGFFVALTLSFGNESIDTAGSVAYALLQMVLGFTPAAWDRWDGYNILGKAILTLFLFICHFLVVTILITILTNSFMTIFQNANEEHQFLFAVNTISHVKSDALFSYVAPTNILQWLLTPLRYMVPFRQYVKVNRTVIKATHFPILFTIYLYERMLLQSTVYDRIDVVEKQAGRKKSYPPRLTRLVREPSVATFRQDRALEEVFRQPLDSTMRRVPPRRDRRETSNVVNHWMKGIGESIVSPQPRDRKASNGHGRATLTPRRMRTLSSTRDFSRRTMSVASDPEEFTTHTDVLSPTQASRLPVNTTSHIDGPFQQTDADGDDELPTTENEEEEEDEDDNNNSRNLMQAPASRPDAVDREAIPPLGSFTDLGRGSARPIPQRQPHHSRNVSSATMIFNPMTDSHPEQSSRMTPSKHQLTTPGSGALTPTSKPASNAAAGRRTPKRVHQGGGRTRPLLPSKDDPAFRSAPNLAALIHAKHRAEPERPKSSLEMDLVSDIGDNRAIGGGYVGAIPASFASQLAQGANASRHSQRNEEQEMFAKIMMARMNSLEEGFREVIHEMRETMRLDANRSRSRGVIRRPAQLHRSIKETEKERRPGTAGNKENVEPGNEVRTSPDDGIQRARSAEPFGAAAQEHAGGEGASSS